MTLTSQVGEGSNHRYKFCKSTNEGPTLCPTWGQGSLSGRHLGLAKQQH